MIIIIIVTIISKIIIIGTIAYRDINNTKYQLTRIEIT